MSWFYVSFSGPDGFAGGAYVQGDTEGDAEMLAELGIKPAGADEMLIMGPLSDEDIEENVPEDERMRLLTREELGPADSVWT